MDADAIVCARLKLLRDELDYLEGERAGLASFEAYAGDARLRRAVERSLQVAIETCLDIGRHLIAEHGLRYPEDNQSVFRVLADAGIVPPELLPRLLNMARFRNLIVHDYARIDEGKVYAILCEHLADLTAFAEAVVRHIEGDRASRDDPPAG